MKEIDDGGPAFPIAETDKIHGSFGMTLRDWFAGQALAGIMATNPQSKDECLAGVAYNLADAMLLARSKGKDA
jgi:hypothetical protein